MTYLDAHRAQHQAWHHALDLLLADYLRHNPGKLPSMITVSQLQLWSYGQTQEPTEPVERPKHVCGLRGYDPMRDPMCPACIPAPR
jgi:hypothetical protein